jgi:hemerythrin-like domain-containing protein
MNAHEVARRIRTEHIRVQDLADSIRETTAVLPRTDQAAWIAEVRDRFDHFRAHMIKHMVLEERDGYMSSVLDRRPTLAGEVERLKREHQELITIMDGIHNAVHRLTPEDQLLMHDCAARIERLLGYVEHHDEEENLMVTYVFTRDLGTND